MSNLAFHDLMKAPLESCDCRAKTVREYLMATLVEFLNKEEGFSGKRPFGNSGWDSAIIEAWIKAGLLQGKFDEDGCIDGYNHKQYAANMKVIKTELLNGAWWGN